jgi:hypothetical protein
MIDLIGNAPPRFARDWPHQELEAQDTDTWILERDDHPQYPEYEYTLRLVSQHGKCIAFYMNADQFRRFLQVVNSVPYSQDSES